MAPGTLRHPTSRGVLLEYCPEPAPNPPAKNRLPLDVRLEAGDDTDDVVAGLVARGGRELHSDRGSVPWRVCADPSGNEFFLLAAREASAGR